MSKIRAKVTGKYQSARYNEVIDNVGRRYQKAKKETLREFFKRVKARAIENIEDNNQETGVPLSHKLEESIDWNVDRAHIWAGNEQTPYAQAHNEDMGAKTLILPSRGKYLIFFNYRTRKWNKRRFVMKPGIAFFTRAWVATIPEIPAIFQEKIDEGL